jgi:hypothetical protein
MYKPKIYSLPKSRKIEITNIESSSFITSGQRFLTPEICNLVSEGLIRLYSEYENKKPKKKSWFLKLFDF